MKNFPLPVVVTAAAFMLAAEGVWSADTYPSRPAMQQAAPGNTIAPGWYPPVQQRAPAQWAAPPHGYNWPAPGYRPPAHHPAKAATAAAATPAAAQNDLSAEIRQMQEQLAAKDRELEVAHAMLEQLRSKLVESLAVERALTEEMAETTRSQQARTSELNTALNSVSTSVEQQHQQITDARSRNQTLTAERDQLRNELASLNAQLEQQHQQVTDAQSRNQTLTAERDQLRKELTSSNALLEAAQSDTSVSKQALAAAQQQIEELQKELQVLKADTASLTGERNELRGELAGQQEQVSTLQAELQALTTAKGQADMLATQLADTRTRLESNEGTLLETGEQLAAVKIERDELRINLNDCKVALAGLPSDEAAGQPPQPSGDTSAAPTTALAPGSQDADGDGVANIRDLCPGTPASARVDAIGCPVETTQMATPAPMTAPHAMPAPPPAPHKASPPAPAVPAAPGKPTAPIAALAPGSQDADADGIPDSRDLCPESLASAEVDATGCAADTAIKLEGVNFANDSHELIGEARRILDRVATVIQQNPDLRLQVAGHTDNQGDPEYNQQLSMQRAEAVMNYLVAKGVNRKHIGAVGYGGQRPIADNSTTKGQQENRRVELRRLPY